MKEDFIRYIDLNYLSDLKIYARQRKIEKVLSRDGKYIADYYMKEGYQILKMANINPMNAIHCHEIAVRLYQIMVEFDVMYYGELVKIIKELSEAYAREKLWDAAIDYLKIYVDMRKLDYAIDVEFQATEEGILKKCQETEKIKKTIPKEYKEEDLPKASQKKYAKLSKRIRLEEEYADCSHELMVLGDSEAEADNIKGALFLYEQAAATANMEKWRPYLHQKPIEHFLSERVYDLGEYQLAAKYSEAAVEKDKIKVAQQKEIVEELEEKLKQLEKKKNS